MIKVVGRVRSRETQELVVEADTYEEARDRLIEQIPDGWELQDLRAQR
ncbi:hypothetical protein V6N00_13315 [Tersicoccus sp. MR15.9]